MISKRLVVLARTMRDNADGHQINEFGGAVPDETADTNEIERSAALARRARLGDYDESTLCCISMFPSILSQGRSHSRTASPE